MTVSFDLTPENLRKLDALAQRTGRSREALLNEAIQCFEAHEEDAIPADWKARVLQAAGIWKDRDDLPDAQELRRSWDRGLWSR